MQNGTPLRSGTFKEPNPYLHEDVIAIEPVFGEELLFEVHWLLTRRCSFSCSYCPPHRHNNRSPQVDEVTLIGGLERLDGILSDRIFRINLTGGEPTIYPAFLSFINHTTTLSSIKAVRIVTNLSGPDRVWSGLRKIAATKPGHIQVVASFHSEQADPLSFVERIQFLLESGIQVVTKFMVAISNLDLLRKLMPTLSGLTDAYSHFSVAVQCVRDLGMDVDNELEMLGRTYLNNISHWYDQRSIIVSSKKGLRCESLGNIDDLIRSGKNSFKGWTCDAGLRAFFIDTDGSVFSAGCKPESLPLFYLFDEASEPSKLQSVICPHSICECASTIRIPKRASERS
ncbi:MAG: radical SAM protein [Chloracidobacterium sp.]|nr:radical SAM protein [Chloracidobacterium sp.]